MRVVVVEDQALLREGIVALLAENGIEVVAQAADGPGLLRIVDGHKPDLAICDVRLPPTFTDEGIRAALEARRRRPELAILVLSQYVEPVYTGELPASGEGGVGYLLKERVSEVRTFVESVKRVAAGGTALDREVVSALIADRDRGGAPAELGALTARERETLELIAQGRTNAAIAREMVVTLGAVESTCRTSSSSSTCPPAMTTTDGCSRCWPTCARPPATDRCNSALRVTKGRGG